jgi:cysteine sulfinate desulfinase/cysteine desulfurase-like protein
MFPAEFQVMAFDLKEIGISAGSACSSGKMKTSHVLTAMGVPEKEAKCAIRVSMGWKTQEAEVNAFIQAWKEIYMSHCRQEAIFMVTRPIYLDYQATTPCDPRVLKVHAPLFYGRIWQSSFS